jgi:hypothetical protein
MSRVDTLVHALMTLHVVRRSAQRSNTISALHVRSAGCWREGCTTDCNHSCNVDALADLETQTVTEWMSALRSELSPLSTGQQAGPAQRAARLGQDTDRTLAEPQPTRLLTH